MKLTEKRLGFIAAFWMLSFTPATLADEYVYDGGSLPVFTVTADPYDGYVNWDNSAYALWTGDLESYEYNELIVADGGSSGTATNNNPALGSSAWDAASKQSFNQATGRTAGVINTIKNNSTVKDKVAQMIADTKSSYEMRGFTNFKYLVAREKAIAFWVDSNGNLT
ncbi:MAG: hypothetical protein ACREIA_12240, partial [Opitutaceae bacterium]